MRSAEELLEIRTQLKGAFDFGLRCRLVAELRLGHCSDKVRYPVARHIDRLKDCQCLSVVPLAVFVVEEAEVIPAGMVRAELDRPSRQFNTALPIARITEKSADPRHGVTTARVQSQCTLGCRTKSSQIAAEVLRHGESVIGHLTDRIGIESALCRNHGALQRIWPWVEEIPIFIDKQNGQGRPGFSIAWLKLDRFLEGNARKQVILRAASLLGQIEPPDSFVGREIFRRLVGRARGDRTSKHAIHIGNRADDAISDFVLQIEDFLRLPNAVEGLCPKVLSRVGVHQLHSDTELVSRLSQAALQQVAGAKFVADSPNDDRLGEIACR